MSECLALLEARGIWHAPVKDYAEVVTDPQVTHNKSFQVVKGVTGSPITLVSHPVRYDGAIPEIRLPPQALGAQSREILKEIGYSDPEVNTLVADRVIALPERGTADKG
jgi:crotonobetainyl-CoA:carnitine CoA-transferase CaiB-like acyl-CoA transferase